MTKTKLLFAIFIGWAAWLLHGAAMARSSTEVSADLSASTDVAVAAYKNGGISALIERTNQCYAEGARNPFYCVYIDLASRHIDRLYILGNGFPQKALNEFFLDEALGQRVGAALRGASMDRTTAEQYLATIVPVINGLVEKKLLGKK